MVVVPEGQPWQFVSVPRRNDGRLVVVQMMCHLRNYCRPLYEVHCFATKNKGPNSTEILQSPIYCISIPTSGIGNGDVTLITCNTLVMEQSVLDGSKDVSSLVPLNSNLVCRH